MRLLENSATVFRDSRGRKPATERKEEELQQEVTRLNDVITEITIEKPGTQKKDWELRGEKTTSMFYDIRRTIETTASRSLLSTSRILSILGISRGWCCRQLHLPFIIDKRFNPLGVSDEEMRTLKYRNLHKNMRFRLLAYSMIDRGIAYLSTSEVYKILKKYDLITPWERPAWQSSKPERSERPDERWQLNIICMKVKGRFFYPVIFIDEYILVHHSLMTSMDFNSVSLGPQKAIERLRKDSLSFPVI
ncbi:MAG: hypothetical protein QXV17_09410 [Candidatus Micrarchaeaceae archaeon]